MLSLLQQGLTQGKIAKELGVSRRTVIRWLNRLEEEGTIKRIGHTSAIRYELVSQATATEEHEEAEQPTIYREVAPEEVLRFLEQFKAPCDITWMCHKMNAGREQLYAILCELEKEGRVKFIRGVGWSLPDTEEAGVELPLEIAKREVEALYAF